MTIDISGSFGVRLPTETLTNILEVSVKYNAANKPGSLTRVYKDGPVGMYNEMPDGQKIAEVADVSIDDDDGFIMIIASAGNRNWRFVLTSSRKMGWIDAYDLGIGQIPGSVYHIDWPR